MTSDEQALPDIVKNLVDAWNAGDSRAFAAPFTDDAAFIHIYGGQLDGRPAIEAAHRQIFDTIYKGSQNAYKVQSIKFLRPDVAVLFIQAQLRFSQGGEPREIHARPTTVLVKEQGGWQIAAFQNTRISEMPAV